MLTRLLKGVWRDTANVFMSGTLFLAALGMEPSQARHIDRLVAEILPSITNPLAVELLGRGVLATILLSSLPSIAFISLALRLAMIGWAAMTRILANWQQNSDAVVQSNQAPVAEATNGEPTDA